MAVPQRTCVGCRTTRPADELVRVARLGDASLVIDRNAPGRGAWLCAGTAVACIERAARKKAFEKAFRAPVTGAAVQSLRTFLSNRERMEGRGM